MSLPDVLLLFLSLPSLLFMVERIDAPKRVTESSGHVHIAERPDQRSLSHFKATPVMDRTMETALSE